MYSIYHQGANPTRHHPIAPGFLTIGAALSEAWAHARGEVQEAAMESSTSYGPCTIDVVYYDIGCKEYVLVASVTASTANAGVTF